MSVGATSADDGNVARTEVVPRKRPFRPQLDGRVFWFRRALRASPVDLEVNNDSTQTI